MKTALFFAPLMQISADPIVSHVWEVLIGQAVVGALVLIGFVAIGRRFIQVEFPAQISDIRDDIHEMRLELTQTNKELAQMRRDVDQHTNSIEALKEWRREIKNDLDETRTGRNSGPPRRR